MKLLILYFFAVLVHTVSNALVYLPFHDGIVIISIYIPNV